MKPTLRGRWKARRLRKKTEFREDPIGGLRGSFRWLAFGACMAVLVIMLGGVVVYRVEQDQDRKDRQEQADREKQAEEDRIQRSIEACLNYNLDQTNDRGTMIEGLRQFSIVFLQVTPAQADRALESQDGVAFVNFIRDQNPYRQCSRACVIANTTPGAAKCGPALNEQGEPP